MKKNIIKEKLKVKWPICNDGLATNFKRNELYSIKFILIYMQKIFNFQSTMFLILNVNYRFEYSIFNSACTIFYITYNEIIIICIILNSRF